MKDPSELLSCTEMPVSSTTCVACGNMLQAWMRWRINRFCLSSAEFRVAGAMRSSDLMGNAFWKLGFQVTRAQYSVYCIENAIPSNNWYERVVAISFTASKDFIGLLNDFFQFHHLTITIDHRENLLFHAERKSLPRDFMEIDLSHKCLVYRFSVFHRLRFSQ